jgi:hypothetical protein
MLGACAGHSNVAPFAQTAQSLDTISSTTPVVYVAGLSNAVVFYPASLLVHNPQPLGSITQGITRASGLWVDGSGTLYVIDSGYPAKILEYKRGASAPFKTITKGFYAPLEPAVDSAGTLYVDDTQNGGVVLVYPPGASSPVRSIPIPPHGRGGPGKMTFDNRGGLLVATFDIEHNTGNVYRIAPGSSTAVKLNLVNLPGAALGTDAAGNIYVGSVEGTIFVYAPGSKTVTRRINAGQIGFYSSFAVTANGTIYWPNYDDDEMFEFAPGASRPTNVFQRGGGIDAAVGAR